MVQYSKAIAGNSDLVSAQAFVYQSNNLNLVMLITASGDDVFTKIRMVASSIESSFFETQELPPARLDKCLNLCLENLKDCSQLQILFTVWQENVLYILNKGSHRSFLYREGSFVELASNKEASSNLVSGHLQKGDRLLFITESIKEYVNLEEGTKQLEDLIKTQPEYFDEEINSMWRGEEQKAEAEEPQPEEEILHAKNPVAAVLINFHTDEPGKDLSLDLEDRLPGAGIFKLLIKKIIKEIVPKSTKLRVIILGLLLLVVSSGGIYAYFNKQNIQRGSEIKNLLTQAKEKHSEAQNLKDLDPKAAKRNLEESLNLLNKAIEIEPNNTESRDLKKQIEETAPGILKQVHINDWPVFLSLDLIKKDFSAKRMSLSLGKVLLLDETKKTLVLLDLKNKTPQILAGEDKLGDAKFAALNGDFAFVYSGDKGVIKLDSKNQKINVVAKKDDEWGKIQDIYGFASNFYLLDSLKNEIWKYIPVESGYSEKQAYFKKNQGSSLNLAKRFHIDSSVWVLLSGPDIKKYTAGLSDHFSISGLDKNLLETDLFFLSDATENIYLLDKGNSRLLVLDKKGEYLSQYIGEKFEKISDFVVVEEEKKIYLLEGNKIYALELK